MTSSYFQALDPSLVNSIAKRLTEGNFRGGKQEALATIHGFLADRSRLTALVNRLSPAGRRVLDLMCALPGYTGIAGFREALRSTAPVANLEAGWIEVTTAGLVISYRAYGKEWGAVHPPLAEALQPLWDAWWWQSNQPTPEPEGTNEADQAGPPSLAHLLAALLGQVAGQRPRMTNDDRLYQTECSRLLEPFSLSARVWVEAGLELLAKEGIFQRSLQGRARVNREHARSLLGMPAKLIQVLVVLECLESQATWLPYLLRWLFRRPGWHDPALIRLYAKTFSITKLDREISYYGSDFQSNFSECDKALAWLRKQGWTEESPDGKRLRLAPWLVNLLAGFHSNHPQPESIEASTVSLCHIQPNFEIIVPPEASAWTAFELASLSRLKSFDRVMTLTLDRQAVQSAISEGVGVDELLARLQTASRFGLPDNVARGVRDFAAGVRQVRVFNGVVVMLPEGLEEKFNPDLLRPTGVPGVFLGHAYKEKEIVALLERKNLSVGLQKGGYRRNEDHSELPPMPTESELCRIVQKSLGSLANAEIQKLASELPRLSEGLDPLAVQGSAKASQIPTTRSEKQEVPVALAEPDPRLGQLANEAGIAQGELVLLRYALRNASERWQKQFVRFYPYPLDRKKALPLENGILNDVKLAKQVIAVAQEGLEPYGLFPILGILAAERALTAKHDLLIGKAGWTRGLILTPHRVGARGRGFFVAGHEAGTQEQEGDDLVFDLDQVWVALGPRTARQDMERAMKNRAPSVKAVGRNDPCPCGSGLKFKKCCLGKHPHSA